MTRIHRKTLFATVVLVSAWILYGAFQDRWDRRGQNGSLLSELQYTKSASIYYVREKDGWGYIYANSVLALNFYSTPGFEVDGLYNPDHSERDRRMLQLLHQCTGLHSNPPSMPQEHGGFVLVTHHAGWGGQFVYGTAQHYVYISSTGELGRGHEWVYVPKALKDWMDSLKPVRPVPPKFTGIIVPTPPWYAYYRFIMPAVLVVVCYLVLLRRRPKQPTP